VRFGMAAATPSRIVVRFLEPVAGPARNFFNLGATSVHAGFGVVHHPDQARRLVEPPKAWACRDQFILLGGVVEGLLGFR